MSSDQIERDGTSIIKHDMGVQTAEKDPMNTRWFPLNQLVSAIRSHMLENLTSNPCPKCDF